MRPDRLENLAFILATFDAVQASFQGLGLRKPTAAMRRQALLRNWSTSPVGTETRFHNPVYDPKVSDPAGELDRDYPGVRSPATLPILHDNVQWRQVDVAPPAGMSKFHPGCDQGHWERVSPPRTY